MSETECTADNSCTEILIAYSHFGCGGLSSQFVIPLWRGDGVGAAAFGIARCEVGTRGREVGSGRATSPLSRKKGGQPFGVTPSRHLLARILAPWRIEHALNFSENTLFSTRLGRRLAATTCSHEPQQP